MGLDIYFDKQEAEEAGLELYETRNGSDESIFREAIAMLFTCTVPKDSGQQGEYLTWLFEKRSAFNVPNADHAVCADVIGVGSDKEYLSVRANKWGQTYFPLTAWLREHNINWYEA